MSREHARPVGDDPIALAVGGRVEIIPNRACAVADMVGAVHVRRPDGAMELGPVTARGRATSAAPGRVQLRTTTQLPPARR